VRGARKVARKAPRPSLSPAHALIAPTAATGTQLVPAQATRDPLAKVCAGRRAAQPAILGRKAAAAAHIAGQNISQRERDEVNMQLLSPSSSTKSARKSSCIALVWTSTSSTE